MRVVVMVMVGAGGGDIWGWWSCYGGMLALGMLYSAVVLCFDAVTFACLHWVLVVVVLVLVLVLVLVVWWWWWSWW